MKEHKLRILLESIIFNVVIRSTTRIKTYNHIYTWFDSIFNQDNKIQNTFLLHIQFAVN